MELSFENFPYCGSLFPLREISIDRRPAPSQPCPPSTCECRRRRPRGDWAAVERQEGQEALTSSDRKSTRLNSSHVSISYAVFCLKKKKKKQHETKLYT